MSATFSVVRKRFDRGFGASWANRGGRACDSAIRLRRSAHCLQGDRGSSFFPLAPPRTPGHGVDAIHSLEVVRGRSDCGVQTVRERPEAAKQGGELGEQNEVGEPKPRPVIEQVQPPPDDEHRQSCRPPGRRWTCSCRCLRSRCRPTIRTKGDETRLSLANRMWCCRSRCSSANRWSTNR